MKSGKTKKCCSGEEQSSCHTGKTPLTLADQQSHALISRELKALHPGIPILSEEGRHIAYEVGKKWKHFWLVDPLSGTKEFIKHNGEFTVNIALVQGLDPVAGVVHAAAKNLSYLAEKGKGAWKQTGTSPPARIRCKKPPDDGVTVVRSRFHPSPDLEAFLADLKVKESVPIGSTFKFCLVAEGKAHLYPPLGPMMEWDSAAGVAGGIVSTKTGEKISYNTLILKHHNMLAYYGISLPSGYSAHT
jgi:3'(2'), 5'-bisphosphate nucleotidase